MSRLVRLRHLACILCVISTVNGHCFQASHNKVDTPATMPNQRLNSGSSAMGRLSSPDDDHIACELTEESLLALRPRPEQPNLNDTEAEQLRSQVVQAVAAATGDGQFPRSKEFLDALSQLQLAGRTRSEAQNLILQELARFAPPTKASTVPNEAALGNLKEEIQSVPESTLSTLGITDVADKLKSSTPVTYAELKHLQAATDSYINRNGKIRAASEAYANAAKALQTSSANNLPSALDPNLYVELQDAARQYAAIIPDHPAWAAELDKACAKKKPTDKACVVEKLNLHANQLKTFVDAEQSNIAAVEKVSGNSLLLNLNSSIFQLESIAEAAHKAISAFAKPDDVGCAMAVLPWNFMRYAFGQRVADEFLGVQVTVRNLNAEKEFLLHDAELAVDMDLSSSEPIHSRFFSGVDKQNVRGYMLAARDYDNRSLWVHSAESIAMILSSAAPIWGGAVTEASSVFNGGFLPAMSHVWSDHHTDQLNQLNDVGFSASRNDRTFVPKSGSTQFVIFIPVRPLEQAWWTQKCVEAVPLGRSKPQLPAAIGLDTEAWRRICVDELKRDSRSSVTGSALTSIDQTPELKETLDSTGQPHIAYFTPVRVKYAKWTPVTYALLKELAFAVIAGTHVTLNSDTHPDITQLDCPRTSVGSLDFYAAKAGSLTCNLSGVNLDKVDHITLRSAADTQTVDYPLKAANGGKTASIEVKLNDLCSLQQPAYKLYTVSSNGIEDGGTQSIALSLDPFLTEAPSPATFTSAPVAFSMKGCHLDKLFSVRIGDSKAPDLLVKNALPSSAGIEAGGANDANLFASWDADIKAGKVVTLAVWLVQQTHQDSAQDSKQTIAVSKGP